MKPTVRYALAGLSRLDRGKYRALHVLRESTRLEMLGQIMIATMTAKTVQPGNIPQLVEAIQEVVMCVQNAPQVAIILRPQHVFHLLQSCILTP